MDILYWLIPIAMIAGFITAVAGGGGVLFVTTAVAFGLDPLNALALNRLTDIGVICGSFNNFRRVPEIPTKELIKFMPLMLFGAIIGANLVVDLSDIYLRVLIIGAAVFAIAMIILQPQPNIKSSKKLMILGYFAIALVGLWDGMIAMAGATLFILAANYFFNMDYLKARVVQMYAGIPETLISAGILTFHSAVTLKIGLLAYFSATIGAYLGSKLAVRGGKDYIRIGMIIVSVLMVAKLIFVDWLQLL